MLEDLKVKIDNAECTNKVFPSFLPNLVSLAPNRAIYLVII